MFDFKQITPYHDGKVGFIAGLSQQIGIDHIFNVALEKHTGRPADIPASTISLMQHWRNTPEDQQTFPMAHLPK